MGELKRASAHVEATALLWAELVRCLERDRGLSDLASLRAWLSSPEAASVPTSPRRARAGARRPLSFPLPRPARLGLPDAPGVYRLLARGGQVLYVGKAASLQRRVNSYFQKRRHDNPDRTLELLTQVRDVAVTVTGSALEAALLESDEIKRRRPPYNRALRDRPGPWFVARDGGAAARWPDDEHPLGPLPAPDSLATLEALLAAPGAPVRARALGLPAELAPGPAIFDAGLALLRERQDLAAERSLAALLRAGNRLWPRLARERERETPSDEEVDEA
jgi:DNA polymerase-3 subunit epsilon